MLVGVLRKSSVTAFVSSFLFLDLVAGGALFGVHAFSVDLIVSKGIEACAEATKRS
jgi:hypothetical protein